MFTTREKQVMQDSILILRVFCADYTGYASIRNR